MTRIVLDEVLLARLNGLKDVVELCDTSGRLLARVFPAVDSAQFEELGTPISEEERQRRREYTGPTLSTAEVLKHLESL